MNTSNLEDVYNRQTHSNQQFYDAYNTFVFSDDRRVFGKLLLRYDFFCKTKQLPGDIVEVGVFRGSGIAAWCKFVDLFIPHTCKTIIGFDMFNMPNKNLILDNYSNGDIMKTVIKRVDDNSLDINYIKTVLEKANIKQEKYLLIEGDVSTTSSEFVKNNPGFRISLLYLDLDLDEPTFDTLCNLWDRVVPGGYVVFDEYEFHKFDESNGVDKFLKFKNIQYKVISTNFYAPTAYIIKE